MPIETLSSTLAFDFARSNKNAKYPKPDAGSERLFPFPTPVVEPSFQIQPDAQIFTMGSCFAREVDRALAKVGFQVISRSAELMQTVERSSNDESLYNKYTIHSILNEIRWALDPDHPYLGESALLEASDGNWGDPQLGGNAFSDTLEAMLAFRKSYGASMRRIAEADVLIITLGLVEAWFDKASGLYLNGAPPLRLAKKQAQRFELRTLDYNDILAALEEIHGLLSRFGKPGVKFLVTVSPVPLLLTFRPQDVLVANTYSKAVQRAALEKFVLTHDNVDYFPSYEFVALGNPTTNWAHDYRHVNPDVVERIMSSVMLRYAPSRALETAALGGEIIAFYKAGDYATVISLAESKNTAELPVEALYRVGLAYKKSNDLASALRIFLLCVERDHELQVALNNAIGTAAKLNRADVVAQLLEKHAARFPEATEAREKFSQSIPAKG